MQKYEAASCEIISKVDIPLKYQMGKREDAMIHKLSHILYGYAHQRCLQRSAQTELGTTS